MYKLTYTLIFAILFSLSAPSQHLSAKLHHIIPKGYKILDSAVCHINNDSIADLLVILKHKNEDQYPDANRPMLVLLGTKHTYSPYLVLAVNMHAVLCKSCGGITTSEPFTALETKPGEFTLHYFGGGGYRWNRQVTFKYMPKTNKVVLWKDITFELNQDPLIDEQKEVENNPENFGKQNFEEYKAE